MFSLRPFNCERDNHLWPNQWFVFGLRKFQFQSSGVWLVDDAFRWIISRLKLIKSSKLEHPDCDTTNISLNLCEIIFESQNKNERERKMSSKLSFWFNWIKTWMKMWKSDSKDNWLKFFHHSLHYWMVWIHVDIIILNFNKNLQLNFDICFIQFQSMQWKLFKQIASIRIIINFDRSKYSLRQFQSTDCWIQQEIYNLPTKWYNR